MAETFFDEGHMVVLPGRQVQPVMSFRDLLGIIETYCGFDVRNMICDCIRDLEAENEDLDMEIKDYRHALECNGEEERELLLSIRDEAETLLDEVAAVRLNRRKMQKILKEIIEMVNEEL